MHSLCSLCAKYRNCTVQKERISNSIGQGVVGYYYGRIVVRCLLQTQRLLVSWSWAIQLRTIFPMSKNAPDIKFSRIPRLALSRILMFSGVNIPSSSHLSNQMNIYISTVGSYEEATIESTDYSSLEYSVNVTAIILSRSMNTPE